MRGLQPQLATILTAAAADAGLWTESQTAKEMDAFLYFRSVQIFFNHKKKDLIENFLHNLLIFSSFFQAMHAPVFYKKN